jgi:hypothetical protein
MFIEEINNQIDFYEARISEVKEIASHQNLKVREEIYNLFREKFGELLSKFRKRMNKEVDIQVDIKKLKNEKKNEKSALKGLNKEITLLSKRKRTEFKQKSMLIERKKEKSIEAIRNKIKLLQKQKKIIEARKFAKKWKKWSKL